MKRKATVTLTIGPLSMKFIERRILDLARTGVKATSASVLAGMLTNEARTNYGPELTLVGINPKEPRVLFPWD